MLRFLTAGESHGKGLVVTVEGLPAGLSVESAYISGELARRRLGFGRGPRMRFEADELTLLGGSGTAGRSAPPWPSRSATRNGPNGRKRCHPPRA